MADPNDTSYADLGTSRYNTTVAAPDQKDLALRINAPVNVKQGRAPRGLEAQVFAWNTFELVTEDVDEDAEAAGDLHGGQLHRANRAAERVMMYGPGAEPEPMVGRGKIRRRGRGGRGGKGGGEAQEALPVGAFGADGTLVAGRAFEPHALPCAKGIPDKSMKDLFYGEDEAIVEVE